MHPAHSRGRATGEMCAGARSGRRDPEKCRKEASSPAQDRRYRPKNTGHVCARWPLERSAMINISTTSPVSWPTPPSTAVAPVVRHAGHPAGAVGWARGAGRCGGPPRDPPQAQNGRRDRPGAVVAPVIGTGGGRQGCGAGATGRGRAALRTSAEEGRSRQGEPPQGHGPLAGGALQHVGGQRRGGGPGPGAGPQGRGPARQPERHRTRPVGRGGIHHVSAACCPGQRTAHRLPVSPRPRACPGR